jgi:hypothetical protein
MALVVVVGWAGKANASLLLFAQTIATRINNKRAVEVVSEDIIVMVAAVIA